MPGSDLRIGPNLQDQKGWGGESQTSEYRGERHGPFAWGKMLVVGSIVVMEMDDLDPV